MRSLFFLSIFGTTLASELLQSGVQSNAKRDIDILASCDYINFWANSWIMSSCTKDASQPFKHKYYASDKFTTTSYLDLNHCIANSGGTLVARAEGNFNQSVSNFWTHFLCL
ncbi:hypothetical protein GGR57DRAFT_134715 [Xylariaceae sp. FL1272]|nr:hypothetical protein GGR57DRAFT_134715 [Xylariaceae sp. FL1272]